MCCCDWTLRFWRCTSLLVPRLPKLPGPLNSIGSATWTIWSGGKKYKPVHLKNVIQAFSFLRSISFYTFRCGKVSMLTHTYPPKPLRTLKRPSAITSLTDQFTCGLMSDLVICKHIKEYGHTWHQMSLMRPGVIAQHKLHLLLLVWTFHGDKPYFMLSRYPPEFILTLKVQNFWKFNSYCSLKPLWPGMGEVVPARTSLYIPHPLPLCINCRG